MASLSLAAEYRVPKREIAADVSFAGWSPKYGFVKALLAPARREVRLFLNERAQSREGAERPSDLLNGEGEFLPTVDASRRVVLLQKDALMVLTVLAEDEFPQEEGSAGGLGAGLPIEVALHDGSQIRGVLRFLMPEGKSRVVDFLNLPERFFAVRDGSWAHLVNKKAVVRVSIVGQEQGK
jgi:hypothetical protein